MQGEWSYVRVDVTLKLEVTNAPLFALFHQECFTLLCEVGANDTEHEVCNQKRAKNDESDVVDPIEVRSSVRVVGEIPGTASECMCVFVCVCKQKRKHEHGVHM